MARLRVTARIETVECVQQNEGGLIPILDPTSEPYLWAAMFTIDGGQVLIVDPPDFTLHVPDPPLRIEVNAGDHGNLYADGTDFADTGVDDGDVLQVPPAAGLMRTLVRPLELPAPCNQLLPRGVHGIVGIAAILLEHDNLDPDDARRGHEAFNAALADELTAFVEGRSILLAGPSEDEIAQIAAAVEARVRSAIQAGFGAEDILDALRGLDHALGTAVWVFRTEDVLAERRRFGAQLESGPPANVWRIAGSVSAIDDCLVRAVNRDRVARGRPALAEAGLHAVRAGLSQRTGQRVREALGAAAPGVLDAFGADRGLEERAVALAERFLALLPAGDGRGQGAYGAPIPDELVDEAIEVGERLALAAPPGERAAIRRWTALAPLARRRTVAELSELAEAMPRLFSGSAKRLLDPDRAGASSGPDRGGASDA